jgi:hypothetical protein
MTSEVETLDEPPMDTSTEPSSRNSTLVNTKMLRESERQACMMDDVFLGCRVSYGTGLERARREDCGAVDGDARR